jgi:hypothetical protein
MRSPRWPWPQGRGGEPPWPLSAALAALPVLALWTLPQTLVGLCYALLKRLQGHRWMGYRFGPFLFLVVPSAPLGAQGICLGLVVLADHPGLLTHEFCHIYSGLWLSWIYLPVYGLEYLILGHDRSPHERLTCRFERESRRAWKRWF